MTVGYMPLLMKQLWPMDMILVAEEVLIGQKINVVPIQNYLAFWQLSKSGSLLLMSNTWPT